MKKIVWLIIAASSVFLLSSCKSIEDKATKMFEQTIIDGSNIEYDADYKKYQYYESNDLLTEAGIPVDVIAEINNIDSEPAIPSGTVHVTFARNPYIAVFYSDQENSDSLLESDTYLNPGDTIYCKKPQASTENSNSYYFQEFRIYTYDKNGNKSNDYDVSTAEDGIVYKIPDSFSEEGLSIVPVGRFEDRLITFHDYFIDTEGKYNELAGEWYVNDKKEQGIQAKADSTDEVEIVYYYDPQQYFLDHTVPDNLSGHDGKVKFNILDVLDEIDEYDVFLRNYITLSFKGDLKKGVKSVTLNGNEIKLNNSKISGLKIGDRIEITTNKDYSANCLKLELESSVNNKFAYLVPEINDNEVVVSISNKSYSKQDISNGTLSVNYSGINNNVPINDGDSVSADTKVSVLITPYEGYYLTGSDVKDNKYQKTMKFSEYQKQINSIISKHPIKKYISVTFDTADPDHCGTVKYTLKNKSVSGTLSDLREGQEVKLSYEIDKKANYTIDRGSNVLNTFSNTFSSKKEDVVIKIKPDLDGKTITRDQYIKVKEGK